MKDAFFGVRLQGGQRAAKLTVSERMRDERKGWRGGGIDSGWRWVKVTVVCWWEEMGKGMASVLSPLA